MSGWDGYIYQIQNVYDATTQSYKLTNVCEHAAIYGHDGSLWAGSQNFKLDNYKHKVEQEDGSFKEVDVQEFKCAFGASNGNRKPSDAGIRMNHQKYMFITHDPAKKSTYLAREGGGGACVVQTKTALIIGVWHKGTAMSNGQMQNQGDCNENTENVAEFLAGQGY